MSRIHLTIDKLVVAGLDTAGRNAFVATLRRELERTLSDPAARANWARSHRTPVLRLNPLSMQPGLAGARKLGGQVAKGIGRGLKP